MRYLLDTCTLYWFLNENVKELPALATAEIENHNNEVYVSVISVWEMAIKSRLGKLNLPMGVGDILLERLKRFEFHILDINYHHASEVYSLPTLKHRDPFDRMLIAQARVEGLTVITNDPNWAHSDYELSVLWK